MVDAELIHGYEVFHTDVREVARFYIDVLGFTLDDGLGQPGSAASHLAADADAPDYLCVRRGPLLVGCSRHPDAPRTPRKPPLGSEVVLRVDDLDAELTRVTASGWPIEDELQHRPWGLTDFRIFDPTGQYIRITDRR